MATKWYNLGKVMSKKAPKQGLQIALGGDKYDKLTVTLTVTDEQGNILAQVDNPYLQVQDPRKRPGITEEQAAKIPAFIKQTLSLAVDE